MFAGAEMADATRQLNSRWTPITCMTCCCNHPRISVRASCSVDAPSFVVGQPMSNVLLLLSG